MTFHLLHCSTLENAYIICKLKCRSIESDPTCMTRRTAYNVYDLWKIRHHIVVDGIMSQL